MGNQKLKWTAEEEEALLAGIRKYGPGKWKNILTDHEFSASLVNRTNIDLKDKWRNLTAANAAQGSKDRLKTDKVLSVIVTPPSNAQDTEDFSTALQFDCKTVILEAVSSIEDPNSCCDVSTIFKYIEERHEVPQNFRRRLSSRLRRLVLTGKLEKVQNSFRLVKHSQLEKNTPAPKQKCVKPKESQSFRLLSVDTEEESTAYVIADAENKSFLAAEAVKEYEELSEIVEGAKSMLELAEEIYKQCQQCGFAILA